MTEFFRSDIFGNYNGGVLQEKILPKYEQKYLHKLKPSNDAAEKISDGAEVILTTGQLKEILQDAWSKGYDAAVANMRNTALDKRDMTYSIEHTLVNDALRFTTENKIKTKQEEEKVVLPDVDGSEEKKLIENSSFEQSDVHVPEIAIDPAVIQAQTVSPAQVGGTRQDYNRWLEILRESPSYNPPYRAGWGIDNSS